MNMDHLGLINDFIQSLPRLDQDSIPEEEICCPICLVSFEDIFKDATAEKPSGVTMLPTCQHIFCRNDLTEWIHNMHGSCPSCRHVFLNIRPPSYSDGESSDDEEYFPDEGEEDEEEDSYIDTDSFLEADEFDLEMEEVDLAMYQNLEAHGTGDEIEDGNSEWGLTDGDSISNSDGDVSFESDSASDNHNDGNVVLQNESDDSLNINPSNDEEK